MEGLLIGIVLVAAVVSRPVEVRLWRAGRVSDRTAALLLVGRFPVIVLLFGLIHGGSLPITIGLTALALLPAALFYRFTLDALRQTRQSA